MRTRRTLIEKFLRTAKIKVFNYSSQEFQNSTMMNNESLESLMKSIRTMKENFEIECSSTIISRPKSIVN